MNVITLYQPVTRSAAFYTELQDLLDEVNGLPGCSIICGDFNSPSAAVSGMLDQQLLDIFAMNDCRQHVSEPTHRYGGLLDLLITSIGSSIIRSIPTVNDLGVSDHFVVYSRLNMSWSRPSTVKFWRRNFKSLNISLFRSKLLASSIFMCPKTNTNDFTVQLRDDVMAILDELAPSKLVTKRQGSHSDSWLSKEAVNARCHRRSLERRYRRTKAEPDRIAYRTACRATNKIINQSRRSHITNRLKAATGDSRQRWRITNELLHKNERPCSNADSVDNQSMCFKFSDYFINKLSIICQTISDRLLFDYSGRAEAIPIPTQVPPLLSHFGLVTESDTLKVIKDCPLKTSPLDFMPISLIKDCSDIFAPLICRLANLSFTEGIFPELLKVGQITPLIKKPGADATEPANYRPITNLNTIGKMLERLAQYQLRQHISTSPNYNTSQSAYRALHSTETAMTKVVNDLLTAVDSGKPTVLLSLDISAAFDMLDHDRLLNRATELFGLSGQVINWLESYLTGRTSYVSIGNCRSSTVNCTTGVPQGSVLGPLLFSIFTSPVSHLISSFNVLCHQYADDTQLYTSIDLSSDHDINNLSDCADAVTRWHLENNLLLNPSKTEVLITGTRQQVTKFESSTPAIQTIRFADTVIPYTKSVRILGVTIDSHLTFDKHVTNVVQSCNYHIRSLRHIRKLIDKDTAATLACSIVSSRLDYCNALLYGITSKNMNRLQRVQNSLARVVCNAPYRSSSLPLRKALHWLPVEQRVQHKIAVMTYKVRLHQQPLYLREYINDHLPARSLRSTNKMLLTTVTTKTATAARAFRAAAPKIWNSLPVTVKSASTINQFSRLLKGHLFSHAFG